MKLLDQVRQTASVKHFSYRAEKAYVYWSERYFPFYRGLAGGNEAAPSEKESFVNSEQKSLVARLIFGTRCARSAAGSERVSE
jgi:hypothetical protein